MSGIVFVAVIGAAFLHATWNALIKGGSDKVMNMAAVLVGHVPFALISLAFVPAPAPEGLPYLFASLLLHFGYQVFLLKSYEVGDLTQVYPIARGSAPLIVALVSLLILGVHLSGLEILAIFFIGAGIISLALVRRAEGQRDWRMMLPALVTGCFIASYSLVDGMGAAASGTSLGYFSWLALGYCVVTMLYLWRRAPDSIRALPKHGKTAAILGGGASFVAYAIVTWAFTQAPIALVTALRETSIIFALLIGVFFLKERLSLSKVFSTFVTVVGVVLLRFARS
ncbi:MAG: EamA family transporter [Brevirhabdus sp.]